MIHKIFIFIVMAFTLGTVSADEFGRLFTTPEQRQKLDALRYQKEKKEVKIDLIELETDAPDREQEPIAPITLNGLIYKKNGQNAAWINNINTMEGDLSLQEIDINTDDISRDTVEIILPGKNRTIRLKVGESYRPSLDKKIDLPAR